MYRKLIVAQQNNQSTTPVQNGSHNNTPNSSTSEQVSPGTRRSRRIRQQQQQQPDIPDTDLNTSNAPANHRSLPSPAVQGVPLTTSSSTSPTPSTVEPEVIDLTRKSYTI